MPSSLNNTPAARFAYPLGLLLILTPLLELSGRLWPLQWYLVQWRFQTEIAVVNATPLLLLGALLISVVAWADESAGVLKLVGVLLVTFGIVLLPVLAMIAIDGLQINQMARSDLRAQLRNNIALAAVRALLASIAAVSLGVGAMRLAKAAASQESHRKSSNGSRANEASQDDDLLIVAAGD